ncbi:DNA-binding transcriptional LysR family regulator [Rhizobium sp. PP-WC-2G-219]|uniref:LysR substrate-binding domain-containing protein n=1 Tax=Rhizobium sp. PP-CC-3G-465 TaxID=2135648 RepID=UPI001045813E|nr:DNA-binding transcriptional LysR family regulator [Rhizobium sp. PP-WC-2G-219]TCQ15723.1 DNA-binding transcriptional LysR family regulator [Rhizobium sp. PP-CC-3G-465]
MKSRKNLPVAALRAFEAAARHGQLSSAAEELGVTHGAVSRHVSHLETFVGAELFEGARNRPKLTAEGRVFGFALTAAFDQMEDALRIIGRGDRGILDVACLSTFAMRWLIPRLHGFTARYPHYDVRLATDDQHARNHIDVQILVLPGETVIPENGSLLFREKLALVVAPSLAADNRTDVLALPRLETRTRPDAWREWARLTHTEGHNETGGTRIFDHYHMTIEAALNSLGIAIAPWHLVAEDVGCGRLRAPFGFVDSNYVYAVQVIRLGRPKTEHFVKWLKEIAHQDSRIL